MKKISFLLIISLCLLTACDNQEEATKSQYIAIKNNLLNSADYQTQLPVDITVHLDKVESEVVKYQVVLENPTENMHNLKAMVVHNYYNEDVFPSIGVFDEPQELLIDQANNTLTLEGTIETTKDIRELNLELKIWLEYTNDDQEKKDIYYRS